MNLVSLTFYNLFRTFDGRSEEGGRDRVRLYITVGAGFKPPLQGDCRLAFAKHFTGD
jgi:hypothetical protein